MHQATIFGQAVHALVDRQVPPTELGIDLEREGIRVFPAEPSLEDVFVALSRAREEAQGLRSMADDWAGST